MPDLRLRCSFRVPFAPYSTLKDEVGKLTKCSEQMDRFKVCWKQQGNDKRTGMRDA